MNGHARHPAFTLVETLAAVALLALAGAMAVGLVSGSTDASAVRTAAARVRDLDLRARHAARSGREHVELRLSKTNAALVVEGEELGSFGWPSRLSVVCTDAVGGEVSAIRYDRRGATRDLLFTCDSASCIERWQVSGLTGWTSEPREDDGL